MHGRGRETFVNGECFIVYYKNGYKLEALASKTISFQVSRSDTDQLPSIGTANNTQAGSIASKNDLVSSFAVGSNNNSGGSLMTGYINNKKKGSKTGADMANISKSNISKSVIGISSNDDDIYLNSVKEKKSGNKGFQNQLAQSLNDSTPKSGGYSQSFKTVKDPKAKKSSKDNGDCVIF